MWVGDDWKQGTVVATGMGCTDFFVIIEWEQQPGTWEENTLDPEKYGLERIINDIYLLVHPWGISNKGKHFGATFQNYCKCLKLNEYRSSIPCQRVLIMIRLLLPLTSLWSLLEIAEFDLSFCTSNAKPLSTPPDVLPTPILSHFMGQMNSTLWVAWTNRTDWADYPQKVPPKTRTKCNYSNWTEKPKVYKAN